MVRPLALAAACFIVSQAIPPAMAQQPPAPVASTRCGGLLCDLYYAGKPAPAANQPDVPDPTHLPCHDFLCSAFGGRTPEAPVPVAEPIAEPAPLPTKTARHKHKAVAKTDRVTDAAK